jgi:hypothetical protein
MGPSGLARPSADQFEPLKKLLGDYLMKSKILFAVAAIAIAFAATSAAEAAKAKKAPKHAGHHKAHHVKGWKSCKGTYQYMKGGKCMDSRKKPSKA